MRSKLQQSTRLSDECELDFEMKPTPELARRLWLDRIARAKRTSPGQRLMAGPELFDFACEITKAGIRAQSPGISEPRVLELLRARVRLADDPEAADA